MLKYLDFFFKEIAQQAKIRLNIAVFVSPTDMETMLKNGFALKVDSTLFINFISTCFIDDISTTFSTYIQPVFNLIYVFCQRNFHFISNLTLT